MNRYKTITDKIGRNIPNLFFNTSSSLKFIVIICLCLITQSKAFSSTITFKDILDDPTDLELNLNYAKQQERAGNFKSTIATLERLSKLYPKNSDIKLYLLSILLKMDSKVKVDFMVKTMLEDPNTNEERKVPLEIRIPNKNETFYNQTFEELGLYTETPTLPFATLGTLGWSHSNTAVDDGSSQFFFFLYEAELNPAGRNLIDGRNAAFGYVVEGEEILSGDPGPCYQ